MASDVEDIESDVRAAFYLWLEAMGDVAGNAFKRGVRPATPAERIHEWDALTPEQLATLRDRKGDAWVAQQGGQIEQLRRVVPVLPAAAPAGAH